MRYTLPIVFFLLFFNGLSQSRYDSITRQYVSFHQSFALEKIYLQTNRETLTLGDTLWFSGYLVDARNHIPFNHSENIYVELIAPTDTLIKRVTLKADSMGRFHSGFPLLDTYAAGNYRIRSYTNYQRNFDQDFFFQKEVKVLPRLLNQIVSEAEPVREATQKINFKFFPEGGDFVAGLTNYFAFEVHDEFGNPINVQGAIINGKGTEVAQFATQYQGKGKAQVIIEPNERYSCSYSYNGVKFSHPFPSIKQSGHLLTLRASEKKIYIIAQSHQANFEGSFVIIHNRGRMLQLLQAKPGDDNLYTSLDRDELPSGLLTVTLFDGENKAVAERIVYNESAMDKAELQVKIQDRKLSKRQEVSIDLNWARGEPKQTLGLLSTYVISEELYRAPRHTIQSYLWLSSDLKGISRLPEMFFDKNHPDRNERIDLICMTHGWRRFDWESIQSQRLPDQPYIAEQGFSVSGRVTSFINKDKGLKSNIYLSFLENPSIQIRKQSGEDGYFRFDGLAVEDTVTAFVKTVSEKERRKEKDKIDRNTYIQIEQQSYPTIPPSEYPSFELKASDQSIKSRGEKLFDIASAYDTDAIMLDEIQIEEDVDPFTDPFKREFALYNKPDQRVVMDSIQGFNQYLSVFDAIRGRVTGVQVLGVPPNQSALVRGFNSLSGNVTPMYLYNGFIVDEAFVNSLLPQEILFIDFLKGARAAIYGGRAAAGVIALYSRKGGDPYAYNNDPLGLQVFAMPGYDVPREFYTPDYSENGPNEKIRPDYRSTVYWNPDIKLTDKGEVIRFYTSDETGKFLVITEGVTSDGKILRNMSSFTVE